MFATRPALAFDVLITEDSPVNQMIATQLFKEAGIAKDRIQTAYNGEIALEYVRARSASDRHLIIYMDYDMPVMLGSEAVAKIREIEQQNGLPKSFIFTCSASLDQPIAGSDIQVPKDLSLEMVQCLIEQAALVCA